MAITLHGLSGSPYVWRVWLALEHKGIPFEMKFLSFDAGDFRSPALQALNPRRRVPVLVDDDFVLYESAAIVEYLEDRRPGEPRLFAAEPRPRALQRRLVREADQYVAEPLERLVQAVLFTPQAQWSRPAIDAAQAELVHELAGWETRVGGEFLAGALSAADFTLFPLLALAQRITRRHAGPEAAALHGPVVGAWMQRMAALPLVQRTWPPHWRQ